MEILANLDLELLKNIFDAKMRGDILEGAIAFVFWRELHKMQLSLAKLGLRMDDIDRRIALVETKPKEG